VLPRNQELLQQALRSSSELVATAASDTLLQLWRSICSSTSAAATAPAHAAALSQALQVLQHGSDSAKASAAEFCWLASAFEDQSSAALLMPDAARVLAAAVAQPDPAPWVVFALAALCNMRERALEAAVQPPAVLQAWLNGDEIKERWLSPLQDAAMAEHVAADHEGSATAAAAAGDDATAVAAQQEAAEYRAEAERLTASAEQYAPAAEALWNALPQAAVLLRCVLQALGGFKAHARLAAAAYQALNCACEWGSEALFPYAWERMQEQFNQQFDQQFDQPQHSDQQVDQPVDQQVDPQQQQQQQHVAGGNAGQLCSVADVLLACVPNLAALPSSYKDVPCFNRTMPTAADVGQLWSKLVASAPKPAQEAVVGSLQEQLCGVFGAADDASTCAAAGNNTSSSNTSTVSSRTAPTELQSEAPCWGCCSAATGHISDRPSSTSSSAAHKAASLLQLLLEHKGHLSIKLRDPSWLKVLELQPNQMAAAAADPAGVAALVKLQHVLLFKQTNYLACRRATEPAVDTAQQQQLQAALAGNSDAYTLIERLIGKSGCSKVQLQRHAASLAAVLQAEPWLQAQQQQEEGASEQQSKQQRMACLTACSLLCKMVAIGDQTAVAEACRALPSYMQQLLVGAATATAASSSTCATAGADSSTDVTPAAAAAAAVGGNVDVADPEPTGDAAASTAAESHADAAEPQPATGDAAASATAVSDADAAAAAAFLQRLLLPAANPSSDLAQSTSLEHVVATAPALVLAALQQGTDAFGQQSLFAQLLRRGLKGCYVELLLQAAVEQHIDVQQLVAVLLHYALGSDINSSTGSGNGVNTNSSSSSSSSTRASQGAALGLAAAAADLLWAVLVCAGKQPRGKVVAAVLAEPNHAQLLQQTLQQAVLQAAHNSDDNTEVTGLARVLRGVCDHAFAAIEPQMTAVLQELMQLAVQQGNRCAAKALAVLVRSQPVLQQLLLHTSALLQALQPGKPRAVQAAALHLLDAWTGTEQGRTAVLQQDWLCIAEVMVQQGSWLSRTDTAAAAAAAGSDTLDILAPQSWCSKESSAELAAEIVGRLMPFGYDALQTEDCVRKLLQAIVCPPAADSSSSSSSSSVMNTGCSSSSSIMPEVEGTAAGDSSSSSSRHRQWSVTVATAAVDALSVLIDESEIGFAAAAKHVGLLLSAMHNTQHAYIARRSGEFVLQIAQGAEMHHICTPQNIDKLLAMLQQPIKHHATSNAAETAALTLGLVVQADVALQLLGEQRRYDTLVSATQHQNDRVARTAADLVLMVTGETIWLPRDRVRKAAQGQPNQQQQQQQLQQQGDGDDPAAQQVQHDQQAGEQQVQQQQDAVAEPAAAAPVSETAAPVPQRWHIQLLVEAAQNPVLAKPLIKACCYIADSCGTYALLLAPYCSALMRAVLRLRRLVGVDWQALNHHEDLSAQQMAWLTELDQPVVDRSWRYVVFVWETVRQVTARVKAALAAEVWEQQAAAVQFALLWRGSESQQQGTEGIGNKRARVICDEHPTAAAAVAAADDTVMAVVGEADAEAAAGGSGGSCAMMEQQQQQQQQVTAALCVLVTHSKRRTDLQQMVRAFRRQL
jgi:hypothetical protein